MQTATKNAMALGKHPMSLAAQTMAMYSQRNRAQLTPIRSSSLLVLPHVPYPLYGSEEHESTRLAGEV